MNVKCGVDLVFVPRMERIKKDENLMRKFFHSQEIENGNGTLEHLAGIVAAKEAFFKCLGVVPQFLDIEIVYDKFGKPHIVSSSYNSSYESIDTSITHEKDYASAVVVMLCK